MKNKGTYIYRMTNIGRKFNQWIPACAGMTREKNGNDENDCPTDFPAEPWNWGDELTSKRVDKFKTFDLEEIKLLHFISVKQAVTHSCTEGGYMTLWFHL